MRSYVYRSFSGQQLEPVAIIYGDIAGKSDVLVRVHDQCFTSEVMGSLRCDCKEQLDKSMEMIRDHGGVIIYLQQEGRGIGLSNKIAAYALQDEGLDTVDANLRLGFREESRDYTVVPDIIKDLHVCILCPLFYSYYRS
jgi:GTP cyclohydrolase II